MNLADFQLSTLLKFLPEEGRLLLNNDRMLLFRQEAFTFLRKVLHEQLGASVTHALLSQFGYRCGFGDYEVLSRSYDWDSEQDALGCGPLMHGWEGIVAVEPIAMRFDRETGAFDFKGIWRNSYEAEIYLEHFEKADRPVCSSLTGYASGWCSAFFGKELLAVEHRCVGMGHSHCEWQVRPLHAWGTEAEYWSNALKATNLSIAQDLERQVNERTKEVQHMVEVLEDKNHRLEELDRMKSEFLANVSHELRTPLTLVLSPLQKLLRENTAPHIREELERMQRSAGRLLIQVNQLLDFARLEDGQPKLEREPVQVDKVVEALREEAMGQALTKNIHISLKVASHLPHMSLDREKFEKIVINLLSNALKFTPENGQIDIELCREQQNMVMTIADTGPGIHPKYHERIFKRFQQVDASSTRRHDGTGIGLALVRAFCLLHEGSVHVSSQLGQGATFKVRLPIIESDATSNTTGKSDSAQANFYREGFSTIQNEVDPNVEIPIVLIADDHEDLRTYMTDLLAHRYQILQATNGRKALELALLYQPKVILSDVMMPELDGIGLVHALKANPATQHIPVILVTARAGTEASSDGLLAGADDYIVKPFTDHELLARVSAAARIRTLYDRVLAQKEELREEIERREIAEKERKAVQQQLIAASREAGRAEVATSILHNAGNVLNSVGISVATMIGEEAEQPLPLLQKIVNLLEDNKLDLSTFFSSPKGAAVVTALSQVSQTFQTTHEIVEEELRRVAGQVEHLSAIVNEQNTFARSGSMTEPTDLNDLVSSALELGFLTHNSHGLTIVKDLAPNMPTLEMDRHKVLQILFNLIKNASEAFTNCPIKSRQIHVRTSVARDSVTVEVIDNGMGIPADTLGEIFKSGFSTKPRGNGFGLHSSANLAKEMKGRLSANSNGLGKGTTMTLWLPFPKQLSTATLKVGEPL